MKIHWDIEQGTEDWFRLKWGKIGGSNAKELFTPSDTLLTHTVAELIEEFEAPDEISNTDMDRGKEMEPEARKQLEVYTGLKFLVPGWVQSDFCSLVGISPDGLTENLKSGCEIKCCARVMHTQTLIDDEIPPKNLHQCLHYFTVIDTLEELFFCSFRPESVKPLFVKRLTRESIIDLGTKTKPDRRPIKAWVAVEKVNALQLESDSKKTIEKLKSI